MRSLTLDLANDCLGEEEFVKKPTFLFGPTGRVGTDGRREEQPALELIVRCRQVSLRKVGGHWQPFVPMSLLSLSHHAKLEVLA